MNKLDKNIISKVSKSRLRTWLKILKTSNLIEKQIKEKLRDEHNTCLLYTSPSPRDLSTSRMPSSA